MEYDDDVDPFIGTDADGHFCYKIVAHEQLNSYGIMESSESNEVCTDQDPIIFVPNAIYLDGINNWWPKVLEKRAKVFYQSFQLCLKIIIA